MVWFDFNTRVWFDCWLPTSIPRLTKDNGAWRDPKLYVNHLIDHSTGEWKIDMIRNICEPDDARLIQSIKPSRHFKADGFCWVHSNSGVYTLKTGYDLAAQLNDESEEQQVLEPSINPLLTKVWNLRAPRKMKHFLWQCLTGCVAVCSWISDRHCGTDHSCPSCGDEEESINHLLFECPPALQTWALSDLPSSPGHFPRTSVYDNFDFLLSNAPTRGILVQRLAKFPWILWYLWKARNDKLFIRIEVSPMDVLQKATQECEEWLVAQQVMSTGKAKESLQSDDQEEMNRLHKPRCQVDASWATNQFTFGGGFVMELEDGSTISGSLGGKQVLTPLHAEMNALLWAMRNSLHLRHDNMHFESDCMQMVKLLEEEDYWPSLASEWEEFFHLRFLFTSFSLSFISRVFNVKADLFAKGARAKVSEFSHVNIMVPTGLNFQPNPPEPA